MYFDGSDQLAKIELKVLKKNTIKNCASGNSENRALKTTIPNQLGSIANWGRLGSPCLN